MMESSKSEFLKRAKFVDSVKREDLIMKSNKVNS